MIHHSCLHLPREHGSLTHSCPKNEVPGCNCMIVYSCNALLLYLGCSLLKTPIHYYNVDCFAMIKSSAVANSLSNPFPVTCSSLWVIRNSAVDHLHYTSIVIPCHWRKRDRTKWMCFQNSFTNSIRFQDERENDRSRCVWLIQFGKWLLFNTMCVWNCKYLTAWMHSWFYCEIEMLWLLYVLWSPRI